MYQRRHYIGCALLTIAALTLTPHTAAAAQVIRTYSSHIELHTNGSADVQEEIIYDFGSEEHHGIYRIIPLALQPLGKVEYSSLDVSSILVTDRHGKRIQAKYDKGGNTVALTIGDPTVTLSGPQLYVIHYTLWGAVTSNLISDQFNWDVLGSDWQVGIERMRAEVVFPNEVVANKITARCASIADTGKANECDGYAVSGTTTAQGYTMRYEASSTPGRTRFMIQATFPKGAIIYKSSGSVSPASTAREGNIVRWWRRPFIDFSLVLPFVVFFALLSLRLASDNTARKKYSVKQHNYVVAGSALSILSFFVPVYNLAVLLCGVIMLVFGLIPDKNAR